MTGILEPTNTPADRVVWIPIEGVQTMSGHDPRAATEISAVLVQLRTPTAGFLLDLMYNKQGNRLTFAYPVGAIIADLFSRISWFDRVLTLVAYLVALVAAGSVLASIYNSMSARRRDLAILRVARRAAADDLRLGGGGGRLHRGARLRGGIWRVFCPAAVVADVIREQTGVVLSVAAWHPVLAVCPLAMIGLCALGGIVPAFKAFRTPVAETLAPVS